MGDAGNFISDTMGELTGANRMADAAGRAAQAQEQELMRGVGFAQEGLKEAQAAQGSMYHRSLRGIQAAKSPQELRALTNSLKQQERAVKRQAELFASIDPTVMEASNQALAILRGEDTAQSTGIAKRRQREREKLMARLREQMGPGAETSTAGMQALNQFDAETEQLQQQGLGQLFGMAQSGAQGRSAMNQGSATLAGIGQGFGQRAGRISQAQFNAGQMEAAGAGLEQGAFSNLINAQSGRAAGAGASNVSDQLRGQARMQQHSQAMGMVGNMFSKGGGGGGAGK